jgi:heat shock protein HtpX
MTIYNQISSNKWRSWFIIGLFIAFITTLFYIFGKANGYGLSFVGIALIFSGISSWVSYYYSDKIILSMSNAHPVSQKSNPQLYHLVENLTIGAGLPIPQIYTIDDSAPNAFATGRDPHHAVICFTTGILEKLNKTELEGVAAHELSHVGNYDTRLMSIVTILVGTVTLAADFFMRSLWFRDRDDKSNAPAIFLLIGIVLAILSPLIATLIQLAVSRKREYLADASGVLLTRYPEGLASALEKISKDKEPLEVANNATAHLYIVNPFKGKNFGNWLSGLFNTHPPIEDRIRILRSM